MILRRAPAPPIFLLLDGFNRHHFHSQLRELWTEGAGQQVRPTARNERRSAVQVCLGKLSHSRPYVNRTTAFWRRIRRRDLQHRVGTATRRPQRADVVVPPINQATTGVVDGICGSFEGYSGHTPWRQTNGRFRRPPPFTVAKRTSQPSLNRNVDFNQASEQSK